MPKHGKSYAGARTQVTPGERKAPFEALELVKSLAFAKFDETVEVATRLGVDPRKADQVVRGTVVLPHGTGKEVRVLVAAQGEKEKEATDAGADYVGLDYLDQIKSGWLDFDPTNNVIPDTDHITVAWGRDYGDVCPVQGVFVGGGQHSLTISVDVEPIEAD